MKNTENGQSITQSDKRENNIEKLLPDLLDIKVNDYLIECCIRCINKKNNKFFNKDKKDIFFHLNYLIWRYWFVFAYLSDQQDFNENTLFLFGTTKYTKPFTVVDIKNHTILNNDVLLLIFEHNILNTYYKWLSLNNS